MAHQEKIREAVEYEEKKKAMMHRIAKALSLKVHDNGAIYAHTKEVYSIEFATDGKVKFTVECALNQALDVFKTLGFQVQDEINMVDYR